MCLSSSFLVITTAPIPRCECVYTTTRANHSRGTPTPRLYFTLKRTGGIFEHSRKPPIAVTPGIASTEACPHGVLGSTYYCLTWPPAILASSFNSSYCRYLASFHIVALLDEAQYSESLHGAIDPQHVVHQMVLRHLEQPITSPLLLQRPAVAHVSPAFDKSQDYYISPLGSPGRSLTHTLT